MRERRGDMPVGRKLGFTNRAAWPDYGPMWGYVYNRTVHTSPRAAISRPADSHAECSLARAKSLVTSKAVGSSLSLSIQDAKIQVTMRATEHDHDHQEVPSDLTLRVKALESLLVEKGLVDPAALDALIDTYEHKVGPRNGARVVARAWVNLEFKQRLLADAGSAISELGYSGEQGADIRVVENTPKVHNVIVCTLCSCYPWPLLGLPPVWYKSAPYRSRTVIDPRGVLREFGVQLADEVEVRVWDSTAEERYFVLPERPEGTGELTEDALAALVTRDAMIGVAKVAGRQGKR